MSNSCNLMDCSAPGSSVHGFLKARIVELVALLLQGIFTTQGWKPVSLMSPALVGGFFTTSVFVFITKLYIYDLFIAVCPVPSTVPGA